VSSGACGEGAPQDASSEREEALRRRENNVATREASAAARGDVARTQWDTLSENLVDSRDANEHLVVASLQSQARTEVAEDTNTRMNEFLAMLSHELRNPLAPIRNAVAILARVPSDDPRLSWCIALIGRQVTQMARLLDDLLDVARVQSGKVALQRRSVTTQEFIGQAVESCRPLAEARQQQLTVELPPELVFVDGDPVRLVQVFANLINNALKYTAVGGRIVVRVQPGDAELVVRVQDNGRGIAADALPRVFDLFAQEDRSLAHAQGGLGIGLTVVRRLVELHGGSVEATSAGLGRGAEFIVRLPSTRDGPLASRASPESARAPKGIRIAVIEDNVDANDSLCALLQLAGHEVVSAYDGPSGLALVRSSRPQIVLCDIGLPGMDGFAIAARLRDEMGAAVPTLVAISGYGRAEDAARAIESGFAVHLTKPVDPAALLRLAATCAERIAGESS
jgi:signal transduction histidine kinase/CheY-like chemotaxis protein